MSNIQQLIQQHCPNGVKHKKLGDLGVRNRGTSITAAKMKTLKPGLVTVFAGGKTLVKACETELPKKDIIRMPSILVKSRGNIDFVYCNFPFTHKSELWSYSILSPDINQKFIYYYLLLKIANLQQIAQVRSAKLPQLSIGDTDNLLVPLPPIVVQDEIVRVLDSFTELEAELQARRKQYEYYRDRLLDFKDMG